MRVVLNPRLGGRDVYLSQNIEGSLHDRAFRNVLVDLNGLFYLVSY